MKFIDQTIIFVKAGRGGDGIASFKSGKGKPKQGPDGGDGGHGGSIYFVGHSGMNTLSEYRYKARFKAEDGTRGGTNACTGACGDHLYIKVPLGTIVFNAKTGDKITEIMVHDQEIEIAKGGLRGLGNMHWTTSTHQTPEEFRPGGEGEALELRLELKLLADVGLAGFPNAGKSTLLSRISAARPKIADYPFTTLVPNLGVVETSTAGSEFSYGTVVVADIPGLIEGASMGKGLGHAFLKHLERTSLIAFVIDGNCPARDAAETLATLKKELTSFSADLASKRAVVIINKIDLLDEELVAYLKAEIEGLGHEVLAISAVDGRGLKELKYRLRELVLEEKMRRDQISMAQAADAAPPEATKIGLSSPESFILRPRPMAKIQTASVL